MASIAAKASLRRVADILGAAAFFSRTAWNGGGPGKRRASRVAVGPSLSRDLLDLFTLLHERKIPYLLVGGVALLKYIDGRNTEDIDLILSTRSLKALPEIVVAKKDRNFARGHFRGLRVDVLLTTNRLFRLVQEKHATTHAFREVKVRCATVEGLLLLKLYALPSLYRQHDGQRIALYEADITMLMERYRPKIATILRALEPHVDAGALEELQKIVAEIEGRIARIDRRPKR